MEVHDAVGAEYLFLEYLLMTASAWDLLNLPRWFSPPELFILVSIRSSKLAVLFFFSEKNKLKTLTDIFQDNTIVTVVQNVQVFQIIL